MTSFMSDLQIKGKETVLRLDPKGNIFLEIIDTDANYLLQIAEDLDDQCVLYSDSFIIWFCSY